MDEPVAGFARQLNVVETVAISLAILSPTATAAITPALTAKQAGPAGPLVFLLAGVTAALIAFSFAQFARRFAHAGSIYAYNTAALGHRYGFVSGWLLAATYTAYAAAIWGQFGDYFSVFVSSLGGHISWLWPGLAAAAGAWFLAHRRLQLSTRLLLAIEGVSVALVIAVALLILVKGGAHRVTPAPFTAGGVSASAIGLGMVFAFLSYSGFEGAATLGEESRRPYRAIPRALLGCVAGVAVLFIFMSWVETVGFGSASALASSAAPLADLARRFASPGVGTLIYLGASASAFGAGLACVNAGARMVFSLARQDLLPTRLSSVHRRYRSPYLAVAVVMAVSVTVAGVLAPFASGEDVFGYLGTLGALWILVCYLLTVVASIAYFGRRRLWPLPAFVVPVIACIVIGYVLYSNLIPVPPAPYNIIAYIAAAYVAVGLLLLRLLRRPLSAATGPAERLDVPAPAPR